MLKTECPECKALSVDGCSWTDHDGEPDGAAWCDLCGWSSPASYTHRTMAERRAEEAAAREAWHAEIAAHPDLLPY